MTPLQRSLLALLDCPDRNQYDLAQALGLDPTAISKMRSGKRKMKLVEAERLALERGARLVLLEPEHVTIRELLPEERQIVGCYRGISDEARHVLRRLCDELPALDSVVLKVILAQLDALAKVLRTDESTG